MITTHESDEIKILEARDVAAELSSPKRAVEWILDVTWGTDRKLIVYQRDLPPEFFELRTGVAGEILQKLVNYQVQLAIVGSFAQVTSESLKAFIAESNRGRNVAFCESLEDAKSWLLARSL